MLASLHDGLIISCQPVPGGPLDRPEIVAAFALAAEAGGARGLRIEGLDNLRAVRAVTKLPIVGLIKRIDPATPIIITPTAADVAALAEAGADIVAFDATRRPGRPATVAALVEAAHLAGRLAMADIADLGDAEAAIAAGADIVGDDAVGLHGRAGAGGTRHRPREALRGPAQAGVRRRALHDARGRPPGQAGRGHGPGGGFRHHPARACDGLVRGRVARAARQRDRLTALPSPVLAIDLGGTKLAVALVEGARVLARREAPTAPADGVAGWMEAIARLIEGWTYAAAGIAVTGLVRDGLWRAINPETLPVPDDFPLVATLRGRLGVPVLARNDAQAAAWGEYRFGAGQGGSLAFLTVSTGIGGGLVSAGRLLEGRAGLAGHFGVAPVATPEGVVRLEDLASGRALTRLAAGQGDAPSVTRAAAAGEPWAVALLDRVVEPFALALHALQLGFDPDRIVIGGGLGLAPGYLDCLTRHLAPVPALMRPRICAAALGADAGLIGIADLTHSAPETEA